MIPNLPIPAVPEADAIEAAYIGELHNHFGHLVDNLTAFKDEPGKAEGYFRNGLSLLRHARERALAIVSEPQTKGT